jgi:folate-binding protein YgfZ
MLKLELQLWFRRQPRCALCVKTGASGISKLSGRFSNACRIAVGGQNVILLAVSDATPLPLREFHQNLGAQFTIVNGAEAVAHYGDATAEHTALRETAGVLDLSFRSRLCLTGADRVRFLHGQVTNDVKKLRAGEGCYAALVTAKGKMESDLNIFCLSDELLLDFEPGLTRKISQRLEKYIVADDVQVVDVAPHYGLLGVQGPKAEAVVRGLALFAEIPNARLTLAKISEASLGEIYLMNHQRLTGSAGILPASASDAPDAKAPSPLRSVGALHNGFDLFIPSAALAGFAGKLVAAAKSIGGRACGWTAFETARIEAGIPRFGADMDETNLPIESGIETRAISYTKGCYVGQEVINRIHSIGHVNRELRGLRLADDLEALPVKGEKLFKDGKEVGYITSAVASPTLDANIALGYVRREVNAAGTELILGSGTAQNRAKIVGLPFGK